MCFVVVGIQARAFFHVVMLSEAKHPSAPFNLSRTEATDVLRLRYYCAAI
jgi:hypothetical protein